MRIPKQTALSALGRIALILSAGIAQSGCSTKNVDAGEAGVYVEKPVLFGAGGVDSHIATTGFHIFALTTSMTIYNIQPQRHDESFNDLVTSDNTPVSFNAYVLMQPVAERLPRLHEKFGRRYYENVIQEPFRTMVRDFARTHTLLQLIADPATTASGQSQLHEQLLALVNNAGLPVQINSVVIGAVNPPAEMLAETARTAAQEQRIKTEAARARAELSRKAAEENKAIADKAYASAFGMNPDQFLVYRSLEIQRELVEAVKDKQNVNVVVNAGGMMGSERSVPVIQLK